MSKKDKSKENKTRIEEQQCLFVDVKKSQDKQNKKLEKQTRKLEKKQAKLARREERKRQKELNNHSNDDVAVYNDDGKWFRLDNAGTIYPAVVKEGYMFVYRFSAVLTDVVDEHVLQQAVNDILPRFPTFNVSLRRGVFWYYLERRNMSIKVEQEKDFPCRPFELGWGKPLIRFLYFKNRVMFECFHALADGRSSLQLFNTLLRRYFELKGNNITGYEGCLNYKDMPREEEAEDSFMVYSQSGLKNKMREKKAFKIKGTLEDGGVLNTINIVMSVKNVKMIAKSHDCGIYVFLCAVMAYSLAKRHKNAKKPFKISVPIDLRAFFESKTHRNFSSYINVEIYAKKDLAFDEVVDCFKQAFTKINKDYLQGNINANTGLQKNWFIKSQPLFIKDIVMKICYKIMGEDFQTLAVSNIGVVQVPPEFQNLVERYEVNLGKNKHNSKTAGLISYKDNMVMTISSKIAENTFERDYVRLLSEMGVQCVVESNRRDKYAR